MAYSKIILCTGGARSGKSAFAEQYCAALPGRHIYIATARILDEEMKARVALHRARRPQDWPTYEAPEKMAGVLKKIGSQADVLLIDCLTLYFSNFLFAHEREEDSKILAAAQAEMQEILQTVRALGVTAVFVTDELGCSIVPMEKISRLYRDLLGSINQQAAAAAEEVYLSVSGITVELKHQAVPL